MKKIILAAALLAVPFVANAGGKAQGSGPSPYTECGIGAAVFPQIGWAAAISNAIWDLGTTALSSATLSPEMCNAKKVKTATLIIETLEAMEADVAKGGGEYTTALVDTMGCEGAARSAVVAETRAKYASVVAQPGYSEQSRQDRAAGLYNTVKAAAQSAAPTCAVSL